MLGCSEVLSSLGREETKRYAKVGKAVAEGCGLYGYMKGAGISPFQRATFYVLIGVVKDGDPRFKRCGLTLMREGKKVSKDAPEIIGHLSDAFPDEWAEYDYIMQEGTTAGAELVGELGEVPEEDLDCIYMTIGENRIGYIGHTETVDRLRALFKKQDWGVDELMFISRAFKKSENVDVSKE
ncbi:MAG: hypothetical protein V3V26_00165 [Candidatus Aenigmarchaeota archaeon]